VAWVRRVLGERRVGHCGTLDPPASGVVVVAVGEATKLVTWLVDDDKFYDATIRLGTTTTTGDREGEPVASAPVRPDDVLRAVAAVSTLVGAHELSPPAVSAVRVDGVRAHARVRAGEQVVLPPRPMVVRDAIVLGHDRDAATIDVRFVVSKGTYIRTLAEHLGARIGLPAHLHALRRIASGRFDLAACDRVGALRCMAAGTRPDGKPRVRLHHAGGLVEAALRDHLESAIVSIDDAMPDDWARLVLDDVAFARLVMGQALPLPDGVTAPGHALVAGERGATRVVARCEPAAPPDPDSDPGPKSIPESDPESMRESMRESDPEPIRESGPESALESIRESGPAPTARRARLRPIRVLDPDPAPNPTPNPPESAPAPPADA
jgi:tRNA pseudouridine55 synthase